MTNRAALTTASVVTQKRAAELTGYTVDQLRSRIRSGEYQQGVIWWKDKFGCILFDLDNLQDHMRCLEKANIPASNGEVRSSESGLSIRDRRFTSHTQPHRPLQG